MNYFCLIWRVIFSHLLLTLNSKMAVRGPTLQEENAMLAAFSAELDSNVFMHGDGTVQAMICSVCDTMPKMTSPIDFISVAQLAKACEASKMTKAFIENVYPATLIAQYTVPGVADLAAFVLSPAAVYDSKEDMVSICKCCKDHFTAQAKIHRNRRVPPNGAIILGYLIGEAPAVLTDLNEIELALCSTVRTNCQSWIYFAGCHQHIQGWHTFYENRPAMNVANISNLADAGMKGQLLVVLCGPFTSTQQALARKQTLVNVDKVIAAFEWLKANNYHYRDIDIPNADDLPIPQKITCK